MQSKRPPGKVKLIPWLLFIWAVSFSCPSWCTPYFNDEYDSDIRESVKSYWPDLPVPALWKAQLFTESRLDPTVCSSAGACGIAQFMDATFQQVIRQLGYAGGSRFNARLAIKAGAFYQGNLRRSWRPEGRSDLGRHDLGLSAYNAGLGNIIRAQALCHDALLWPGIAPCLQQVTGQHATETIGYVEAVHRYWRLME